MEPLQPHSLASVDLSGQELHSLEQVAARIPTETPASHVGRLVLHKNALKNLRGIAHLAPRCTLLNVAENSLVTLDGVEKLALLAS